MTLKLRDIHAAGPDRYEVTFEADDGTEQRVAFRVSEHRGVLTARPEPDVFMTGEADAREVTAAVLGFHRAQPG